MLGFRIRPVFVLIFQLLIFRAAAQAPDLENTIQSLEKEENYDSVISILEHAIHYTDLDQEKRNKHLAKLVNAYLKNEDYVNASTASLKWILVLEKKPPTSLLAKAYAKKAEAEYHLNNIENSARYIEKSYALNTKLKDEIAAIKDLIRIGILYQESGQNQKAITYYRMANDSKENDAYTKSIIYNCFSVAFSALGENDSSLLYVKKCLEISKKIQPLDTEAIVVSMSNLAATYIDMKEYKSAIQYLDSTKNYDWKKVSSKHIASIYRHFYNIYFKLNNIDSGNFYLKKYTEHNEKMFHEKMKTEITELEVLYKKEKEYLKQSQESKINALNLQKLILLLVIVLLVLLIFVIVYVYLANKKKTKIENDKIRIEQRLLRTQMNPHFILNTLTAIQTHVEDNQAKKASKYLNDFARLMQITLENSTENFISIESELKALGKYLSLQLMRFENEFEYKIQIEEKLEKSDILIPPMIIQPFVENAIHHGIRNLDRKGKISIVVKSIGDAIECTIDDNGRGIVNNTHTPKNKQSLSTQIIRQRLEILKMELKKEANVKVIDKKEKGQSGVKVIITIPYIY